MSESTKYKQILFLSKIKLGIIIIYTMSTNALQRQYPTVTIIFINN